MHNQITEFNAHTEIWMNYVKRGPETPSHFPACLARHQARITLAPRCVLFSRVDAPTGMFVERSCSTFQNTLPQCVRETCTAYVYIIRLAEKNLAPVVACRPPENCIYHYT